MTRPRKSPSKNFQVEDLDRPIENYGIIGDLHTAALVGMDGSIDWCCFPHFDSPSVFGAMIDRKKGGHFKIAPLGQFNNKQLYRPETNILVTRFLHKDGVGEVTDFMPLKTGEKKNEKKPHDHQIVRMVRVVRGKLNFRLECFPAFDYARAEHTVRLESEGVVFESDGLAIGLNSSIPLKVEGSGVVGEFTLVPGEARCFILKEVETGSVKDACKCVDKPADLFDQTRTYWRTWLKQCQYRGRWREMVQRSALTLKLLTYAPTGAIIAGPTTSLPGEIGGERNFDYRFTWIRDASFILYALLRLGFTDEADGFMNWLEARCGELNPDGSLQVMYGINGEHDLHEQKLTHLSGWKNSLPIRLGNAAYNQFQLDIYGELMDSVYLYSKYAKPVSYDLWVNLRRLVNWVCDHWQDVDASIWEVRGGHKHFVYSKVMCWVAVDRALRMATKHSLPGDIGRWQEVRNAIYEEVMEKGWNPELKSFVQYYGSTTVDASLLIMPLVMFISPVDPRFQSTMDLVLKTLVSDSLVYRYKMDEAASDGLAGGEGTFSLCTFWLVEALTRAGRLEEARTNFEKMLTYANHLGLYAEEIGLHGEQLGNFPQGFTHLGLISAAFNLNRALGDD